MRHDRFLAKADWPEFIAFLLAHFDRLVGPTTSSGAVVLAELESAEQLPWGVKEQTEPGAYRLSQDPSSNNCFDWVSTAQGLKPWLFLPEETLWQITTEHQQFVSQQQSAPSTVVLGVRACDLAALQLLDQHFIPTNSQDFTDPRYQSRREQLFIIAVNCHRALETCFCVSTGDGPQVSSGHDLVLDELDTGYLLTSNTKRGDALMAKLELEFQLREPSSTELEQVTRLREKAAVQQRSMPDITADVGVFEQIEKNEALWQNVAERCLTCGNCTAVCPTCFCFRIDNEANLDNSQQYQVRRWDSCFTDEHSYLTGHKVVHQTPVHKYRQWFMHKLIYWQGQYQRPGCTGCGRCLTWCPAAIDLVEEVKRLISSAADVSNQPSDSSGSL